jgi:hypothetical protein
MFGSNLVTIGGNYEHTDHDLLSTAVREWNEEMTPNVPILAEDYLYNRYAIQSRSFINILLPLPKLMKFKSTDEIYTLIWITAGQLKAMKEHQNVILSAVDTKINEKIGYKNVGTRAYVFSTELNAIADSLIEVMNQEYIFTSTRDLSPFERPKRELKKTQPRIIESMDEFSANISSGWHASAIIITSKHFVICRPNDIIYKLPLTKIKTIVGKINQNKIKLLIPFDDDLRNPILLRSGLKNQNVISIQQKLDKANMKFEKIEFIKLIRQARSLHEDERIQTESELIFDYEYRSYQRLYETKILMNLTRGYFLQILNMINHKISQSRVPLTYLELVNVMKPIHDSLVKSPSIKSKFMTIHSIVSFLIKTQVLSQDPETTIVTIP